MNSNNCLSVNDIVDGKFLNTFLLWLNYQKELGVYISLLALHQAYIIPRFVWGIVPVESMSEAY